MKNVFDVTDFGAVGDGINDCTAAFQAAIDEAEKNQEEVPVPVAEEPETELSFGQLAKAATDDLSDYYLLL